MVKALNTKLTYFLLSAALLATAIYGVIEGTNASARDYCNDECKAAMKREEEANAKAKEATEAAQSVAEMIQQLNVQIAEMEAHIAETEADIVNLTAEIQETEKRLNTQQASLADLLVQLHFEGEVDPIQLLAGSDSLSDYANKQARLETVKSQISISANAIKTAKEQLELNKKQVEASLAVMEIERAEVARTRSEQSRIMHQYENDAAGFSADAEEARQQKAAAIAAEIAKFNSGGIIVDAGTNSYPWQNRCPQGNLTFMTAGGYGCQCTSYAAWKVQEFWGITISAWGNANNWGNSALIARRADSGRGFTVDSNPAPYTVGYNTNGYYGHVVWIESVNGNGTVNLSEYNYVYGDYSYRANVPASTYRYIHFDQPL